MSWTDKVQRYLAASEQPVQCLARHFCRDFEIPETTLRGHLLRDGTNFRKLRDREILDRAMSMIRDGRRDWTIARDLGYSTTANFQRAFRTLSGTTVGHYRAQIAQRRAA